MYTPQIPLSQSLTGQGSAGVGAGGGRSADGAPDGMTVAPHGDDIALDAADGLRCVLPAGAGRIVLSAWPGLRIAPSGEGWIDPEAADRALAGFAALGVTHIIGLCETPELPPAAVPGLRGMARAAGLRLVHAPVHDYAPPGAAFMRVWHRLGPGVHRDLDAAGGVAFCCLFGAGRSGTVAAMLLHARGLAMPQAIATVRTGFALAIESAAQEAWLNARA